MARIELIGIERLRDGRFIATFRRRGLESRFKVVGPAEDWSDALFDAMPAVDDDESKEVDRLLASVGINAEDTQWIDVAEKDWGLIERYRLIRLSKGSTEEWTEEEENGR
ncbi:MAG: hypothetical protein ACP5QG_09445 [candidate division WOR-3 bacterium]